MERKLTRSRLTFSQKALKAGQTLVATTMVCSGLFSLKDGLGHRTVKRTQPAAVPATETTTTPSAPDDAPLDLLWLDENNLIINYEILTYEEAFAKYPDQVPLLQQFIEDSINEFEAEYGAQSTTPEMSEN